MDTPFRGYTEAALPFALGLDRCVRWVGGHHVGWIRCDVSIVVLRCRAGSGAYAQKHRQEVSSLGGLEVHACHLTFFTGSTFVGAIQHCGCLALWTTILWGWLSYSTTTHLTVSLQTGTGHSPGLSVSTSNSSC